MVNSTNKCDITFSPYRGDDGDVVGATGNQHAEEQNGTEKRTDRLWPRPALKFPKISTQAMLHSDFECNSNLNIHMYVQVAQCCIAVQWPGASWQPQVLFKLIISGENCMNIGSEWMLIWVITQYSVSCVINKAVAMATNNTLLKIFYFPMFCV